jgi:glycosyltransferase involved in cell wall biosynthesis
MGGIVRYCQDILLSELAKHHEIVLFRDNIPSEYRSRVTTEKNTWNVIKRDGLINTGKVIRFVAGRMIKLNRDLGATRFDLLHVLSTAGYGFFRNAVHIKIAKRWGVRTVFHLLGQIDDLYKNGNPLLKRMVSSCLNEADACIVQSPLLAEYVRSFTKTPVYSIFNGVRAEELTAPAGFAHSPGNKIKVVTLGYLGYQKGTFDIIDAAERLKDKWLNLEFTLIGGGEVEKFRRLVKAKSLSDRITFTGKIDDELCIGALQTSDIFLLPSYAEGQPIALLEAMAAGLPVISSRVGAVPEVVKEGENGFLIEPGDIDAIAKYLQTLASDAALREQIGRFNTLEAKKKYGLKRVMRQIQEVYDTLCDGQ